MNCMRFKDFSRHGGQGLPFLVLTMLLVFTPVTYPQSATSQDRALAIENSAFEASGSDSKPILGWTFESLKINIDPKTLKGSREHKSIGDTQVKVPRDRKGACLESTVEKSRGDLVSSAFDLEPFQWVEVTLEYAIRSGEPLPFLCLRPTKNRAHVDLAFLPRPAKGKKTRATVKLHSGLSDKPYSLAVSITGKGSFQVYSIAAQRAGDYPRPERPVLVLDMLHINPPKDGKLGWKSVEKLKAVFGFPAVESLHFKEATREKLEALDPALIILSPKSEEIGREEGMKMMEAVQLVTDYPAPVVGICLGHQILAMCFGGRLARKFEEGPDGKDVLLTEFGTRSIRIVKEDPLFNGMPRHPTFCASESHRSMVGTEFTGAELLASTDICETQIYHYRDKPWYTFQCHIERDWEYDCPEAYLLWQNMLRFFFLAP